MLSHGQLVKDQLTRGRGLTSIIQWGIMQHNKLEWIYGEKDDENSMI